MTRRTKSELLSIFANNTTGEITPTDIRDFVESVTPSHGSIYMVTPQATTIAVPGTYYKASGLTMLSDQTVHYEFDMPDHNRLRWTGAGSVHVDIRGTVSMTSSGSNVDVGIKLAKNGVVLDHSEITRKIGTGADKGAAPIEGDCELNTGDYVEVFVTNFDGSDTITLNTLYLAIKTSLS